MGSIARNLVNKADSSCAIGIVQSASSLATRSPFGGTNSLLKVSELKSEQVEDSFSDQFVSEKARVCPESDEQDGSSSTSPVGFRVVTTT